MASENIHHKALKAFLRNKVDDLNAAFDPEILLKEFPRLRMKGHTRLRYGYRGSPLWDGAGYVYIIENGKPEPLSRPDIYKKYVCFDKCAEGFLQFVLFREELDLLTLKQHANYAQSWFVPSKRSFERICSHRDPGKAYYTSGRWYDSFLPSYPGENARDSAFWRRFRFSFRSLAPTVTVEGERARIKFFRFSPWGGIYPSEYLMDTVTGTLFQESGQWAFPVYRKGDFIIPFHCGVML
ncbi:MAG TPA: hypothetical protein PKY31_13680 [Spirochaetota bacterium]|nr:hypothetical protein [Spirochaetota bacterium]